MESVEIGWLEQNDPQHDPHRVVALGWGRLARKIDDNSFLESGIV